MELKEIVSGVLSECEKSRNSDTLLILQTLRKMGFKIYIDYKEIGEMPSFESITRVRRKLQNEEGLFLATEDVDTLRKENEKRYRETAANNKITVGAKYE